MSHYHIAIVEDDDTVREILTAEIKAEGYRVSAFFSAEQFEKQIKAKYDLLLLDLMLPGKSGLDLLKEMQIKQILIPTIMLTAIGQENSIEKAYKLGVIDYITKPFKLKTLIPKISNLLERVEAKMFENEPMIGNSKINFEFNKIIQDRKETLLTAAETEVLEFFYKNSDRVITREELHSLNIDQTTNKKSRIIDNYILKFRKIFEQNPSHPEFFVTIHKKGYALHLRKKS